MVEEVIRGHAIIACDMGHGVTDLNTIVLVEKLLEKVTLGS